MNLNEAIEKHAAWKTKFRRAISEHQTLDVATIAKDNCCDLGKWLHGEAKTLYGHTKGLLVCIDRHAAFHKEASMVAETINHKKFTEASTMLEAGTSYSSASNAVGVAIMQFKKEIGA
ncbi:MAG: CZB domain-containing protein [Betaproteobacteria bacterium]|nr:CZB domain-containing protein [Betaproteobacteria bacterium]